MSIVQEVLDAIKAVADGVENVRRIVEAVRDGRAYLAQKHPEARAHVAGMLDELHKNMRFVREGASVLTGFWFTVGSSTSVETFNDLYRRHLNETQDIERNFDALRGHCSAIREHAEKIDVERIAPSPFRRVFQLLNLHSDVREAELAAQLELLANEEFTVATMTGRLLNALKRSLDDVQTALGRDRVMDPANAREAGQLLEQHAKAFEPLEAAARDAAAEIEKVARAMA